MPKPALTSTILTTTHRGFWILLSGELRLQKRKEDGELMLIGTLTARRDLWRGSLVDGEGQSEVVITVLKAIRRRLPAGRAVLEAHVCLPAGAHRAFWETWLAGCRCFSPRSCIVKS